MTTNVPFPAFTNNGFVVPTQAAILTGVEADFQAAFGGGLNLAPETPQGQLISSLTAIIADCFAQEVALFNGVDPAFATGRMQDALCRIYFLTRNPAVSTVVSCTCIGAESVIISTGTLAQDVAGNLYACTDGGTIPSGGSITLSFAALVPGPTACPSGTLTTIYQAIPGWDSITNPADGVIGEYTETAAALELRREQTVQANAIGIIGAIVGAVAQVPGVLDYFGYDNATSSPATVYGVTVAANSIYIAVSGGDSLAVAQAILSKKAPGCAYTGNTTVTAYDNNPLYSAPIAYSVTFEIPSSLPFLFAVSIKNSTSVPSNALELIQGAIIAAFAGDDGGPRPRIASTVFASRFYSAVALLGAWAQIETLQIGTSNTAAASFTGVLAGTALTVSSVTGTVAIGQTVIGAGVLAGTTIVSGSGTSWVVSISQTVSSEAMFGVLADQNVVSVNANQEPTIAANNIVLTLI